MAKNRSKKTRKKVNAKASAAKPTQEQRRGREPKPIMVNVVSFRLDPQRHSDLSKKLEKSPVLGCNSVSDFARKVLADYIAGRAVYPNEKHLMADFDKHPELLTS